MLYFFSNHLLDGDCGASWFVFLVGLCQLLSVKKHDTGQDKNVRRVIVRGMAIFVGELLFLLVIQGYRELWDWDILTFIGAMTIILLFYHKVPSWAILLFCAAVLFITPWLQGIHPRNYGAFARKLKVYALGEKLMDFNDAIRSMTFLPAEKLGMQGRGKNK
ncbi:MAG: heparan-alpha-glucosaminide N-acetyltransferase domain-containing protein [Syntrophorhabdales bacterium]|jgi:uncharacterized membrane protein